MKDLTGDRFIEWSWVIKFLPRKSTVLDIGCCYSILPYTAAFLDNDVIGVDLNNEMQCKIPNVKMIIGDITEIKLDTKFDFIIICSTIEHIGIPGRYNSKAITDGDLLTMEKIKNLLTENGKVCLTLPIGLDESFLPIHKIYGKQRLPVLLQDFNILEKEFWDKSDGKNWEKTTEAKALETKGSSKYYCLGLFLIERKNNKNL